MILALGLSGLVLVAVAMAIDIHLRLVDSNRTGVEEAQLARVLLDRIAEDLGNVVQKPPDVEKMVANATAQAAGAAGAAAGTAGAPAGSATANAGGNATGGTSSGGTGTGGTSAGGISTGGASTGGTGGGGATAGGTSPETNSTGTAEGDTASTGTESLAQLPPGLYGNLWELQVDTSRLPRIDEIQGVLSAEGSAVPDALSDLKTVAYYVLNNQLGGAGYAPVLSQAGSGLTQTGTGLARLELDRATAVWLAQQGQLVAMTQDVEPIAPELAAIEFHYFDGTEMLEEWDSSERGGLPVAVEIAIYIIPARHRNDPAWTSLGTNLQGSLTSTSPQGMLVFRRLVYLPTAQPSSASTASGTSGTSSGGTTGGTGQVSTGGSVTGGSMSGGGSAE